jgi:cyclic pyranopterin monophosphate synthase
MSGGQRAERAQGRRSEDMSGGQRADGLTHLDEAGRARMVDVGAKDVTVRTAAAEATVLLRPDVAQLLADGALPKGDAIPVARIAGIQAAKRTPELIPLCHGIALTAVEIAIDVDAGSGVVRVTATTRAADRTGVEMEALVAAATAALTIYDMVKAVQRDAVITDVRLLAKTGGTRGDYARQEQA